MGEYYIITTRHKAIWPSGVLLFWGPDRSGYATTLDLAGRYPKEEAEKICGSGKHQSEFMVPCERVESDARRVVDTDKLFSYIGKHLWEFEDVR